MRGKSKPGSKRDQFTRFSMGLFAILVLIAVLVVSIWTYREASRAADQGFSDEVAMRRGLEAVDRGLEAAKPYLALWRLVLFLALIGGWRHWIGLLASWGGLDETRTRFALAQRWRMAAWLIVVEAVLVQELPAKFVRLLLGG